MNEADLLSSSEDNYMNSEQLAFFDQKLVALKDETILEIEHIHAEISSNKVSDMNDRATIEEENLLALRLAERKSYLLSKIDAARDRIRHGDYGYCMQSGEPIGIQRLLIRPTAEYCADVKQLNERREKHYES
jgi:DnaK suppressor protein